MKGKKIVVCIMMIGLITSLIGCGKKADPADILVAETEEEATEEVATNPLEAFEEYANLEIEKIDMKTVIDAEGHENSEYVGYILSDINLINQSDATCDYLDCLGDEFVEANKKSISFSDAFGFDYKYLSNEELYNNVVNSLGFSSNTDDISFDQDTYDAIGEKNYIVNEACPITEILLSELTYDEVVQQKCILKLDENEMPIGFTAVAQVRCGEEMIIRTTFLGFEFYNKADGDGACKSTDSACDCGHDDMSDCNEDCEGVCGN